MGEPTGVPSTMPSTLSSVREVASPTYADRPGAEFYP
jgi:hypothetical protein